MKIVLLTLKERRALVRALSYDSRYVVGPTGWRVPLQPGDLVILDADGQAVLGFREAGE